MPEVSPAPFPASDHPLEAMRLASDRRMVRFIFGVMLVQCIVMVTSDLLIARAEPESLGPMLYLRVASILGTLFFIVRFEKTTTRQAFNDEILLCSILAAFTLLALQGLRPANNLVLARFEMVSVVGMYAALPNRPLLQLIPAGILSIGATAMYAFRPSEIPFIDVLTIAEVLVIANGLGWYVSRRRQRLQLSEEEAWSREVEARTALERTLRELRVLRGVIPICGHCRKIRSEVGDWQQLELYVREHSEADFSHGMCPDCLTAHYPAVAAEMGKLH